MGEQHSWESFAAGPFPIVTRLTAAPAIVPAQKDIIGLHTPIRRLGLDSPGHHRTVGGIGPPTIVVAQFFSEFITAETVSRGMASAVAACALSGYPGNSQLRAGKRPRNHAGRRFACP